MEKKYILNRETGKIELHFEKSEYQEMPEDKKRILRSNYLFSRKAEAWVSRAKYPNLYSAKHAAEQLGFTEGEKIGERLTYAEQLQRQTDRAEARADRYLGYAENAERRGAELQKELDERRGDIAFFTQPIIPGHSGSESFARRRRRIYERYDKGMEEYRKSEYFKERAEIAQATAENAKLKDFGYLNNRIKECNSAINKLKSNLTYYEKLLEALKDPESDQSKSGRYPAEKVNDWQEDMLERLEMQIDKLGFFENCVEELGGYKFSRDNIKAGYIIKVKHCSQAKVLKANPKTVLVKCLDTDMILTYDYAEIKEIISATEEKINSAPEAHPYRKDDILVWDPHGTGRAIAAYQVIGTTDKTVQLREINLDADRRPISGEFVKGSTVIRRKPFISYYSKKWNVCGEYDRVLRKYENREDTAS